jgi:NAD+ kinase
MVLNPMTIPARPKLFFIAAPTPEAQDLKQQYLERYTDVREQDADVIIAIGGDGLMLRTLHHHHHLKKPVYGINCGSVGFLMNSPDVDHLITRLHQAHETVLHPLKLTAYDIDDQQYGGYAINEVSLFRASPQAAHIQIIVDQVVRIENLVCDGVLLATPAGSTAYNLSAHGPIIPIDANLLALTAISPFRPRRWRGALLPDKAKVSLIVLDQEKRPVYAAADDQMIAQVSKVEIEQDITHSYILLFDPDHNLEERIIKEQFVS